MSVITLFLSAITLFCVRLSGDEEKECNKAQLLHSFGSLITLFLKPVVQYALTRRA